MQITIMGVGFMSSRLPTISVFMKLLWGLFVWWLFYPAF